MARHFKDKQQSSTKPFKDEGHSPKIKDCPSIQGQLEPMTLTPGTGVFPRKSKWS